MAVQTGLPWLRATNTGPTLLVHPSGTVEAKDGPPLFERGYFIATISLED